MSFLYQVLFATTIILITILISIIYCEYTGASFEDKMRVGWSILIATMVGASAILQQSSDSKSVTELSVTGGRASNKSHSNNSRRDSNNNPNRNTYYKNTTKETRSSIEKIKDTCGKPGYSFLANEDGFDAVLSSLKLENSIKYINAGLNSIWDIPVVRKDAHPYNYNDLPKTLKYMPKSHVVNTNCHLGQRKLLLTEIEFYTKCIGVDTPAIAIYAGSADGEHTPIILDMFPKLKLLFIDPNYHSIDKYQFEYIYQNIPVITQDNITEFLRHLPKHGSNFNSARRQHQEKTARFLKKTQFSDLGKGTLSPGKHDVLEAAVDYHRRRQPDSIYVKNIMKYKDDYDNKDYKKLFNYIENSENRVFIIQDYMTKGLSEKFRESIDEKCSLPIFFLTDIRTTMFERSGPHDLDLLWNYALQIMYLKIIKPEYSMLKFRPPYFMGLSPKDTTIPWFSAYMKGDKSKTPDDKKELAKIIKYDLDYVRDTYKIDLFGQYLKGKFIYLDNDFIYAQPWAPNSTTESRLFISKSTIDKKPIIYDQYEWEDKFFYLRHYRMLAFSDVLYKHVKKYNEKRKSHFIPYSGSYDCFREMMIFGDYLLKKHSKNSKHIDVSNNISKTPISEIDTLFKDEKILKELHELEKLTTKYTYYGITENDKCKFGTMLARFFVPVGTEGHIGYTYTAVDDDFKYAILFILRKGTKKISKNDIVFIQKLNTKTKFNKNEGTIHLSKNDDCLIEILRQLTFYNIGSTYSIPNFIDRKSLDKYIRK